MNILWLTWKDNNHPEAGGAEVVCYELCKRLVAEGHTVTLLTSDYDGAKSEHSLKGVHVIRIGKHRALHPYRALLYYIRHLRNKFDIVIEEVNGGAPYFSVFFGKKSMRYMLYHQLGRINWLYEVKPPFSYVGYHLLVGSATRLASLAGVPLITVSESTKRELATYGFKPHKTHIISEGTHIEPLKDLRAVKKYSEPTVLVHGGMRAMKRTLDQVKAFELAKKRIPNLRLKLSGSSSSAYGKQVMDYIAQSPYKADIEYLGRTTDEQKVELMRRCHVVLMTSIEEGWGLVVTEANSQGTPAVVYDVHGLRDSVKHGETGIITAENPAALADGIVSLLQDQAVYDTLRQNGWEWSKTITFDQSYTDFKQILGIA